ncbi:uncharacterized protein KGF55_005439 [Candida pseudojiufengensis]|uniref:uncharacterized protein n=1 Tax=Candida pseudojiufengensis TaxID=497109 RepID=UPI002224875F|nr:uncharacterized protein KGF55_005439 [Candida pseudojiufengensis]KAI5959289.1 hypothetical protein KGF55_005439 [Candida pseudojiufengensis]
MTGLSKEQLDTFNKEGMLCIPDFLTQEQTKTLLNQSKTLINQCDLTNHPKTTFKTSNEDHIGDKYFYESADKISYFFDVDAFNEDGELAVPLNQAINKIGHGLHLQDPIFKEITFSPRIKNIAKDLDYKDPKVLQSMLIFKHSKSSQEDRDNAVPPHMDSTFLYTSPKQSALGFWIALEDCNLKNGCLSYIPGSHLTQKVTKRFIRSNGLNSGCKFEQLENEEEQPIEEEYKSFECKAGSLILIHNSVLHKSEKNKSIKSRFVYAFHLIDGITEYDEKNWLQIPYTGGNEFSKLYEVTV